MSLARAPTPMTRRQPGIADFSLGAERAARRRGRARVIVTAKSRNLSPI
ncbi:hypothetical protein MMMB2_1311 [Mycobacterium marinum MB2]|nr:hypothetical protein MMMB2_1311 [Mycobacterium marinum MB2]